MLHDVGKAIDPQDHVAAGVEALRGAVTERTLWLIEHHMDLLCGRDRPPGARWKIAGVVGVQRRSQVAPRTRRRRAGARRSGSIPSTKSLDYLKGLEEESYLGK